MPVFYRTKAYANFFYKKGIFDEWMMFDQSTWIQESHVAFFFLL